MCCWLGHRRVKDPNVTHMGVAKSSLGEAQKDGNAFSGPSVKIDGVC